MKDERKFIDESSLAQTNPDLRLMELADRNLSLGGRELLKEIIERGAEPEENDRSTVLDLRAALRSPSLDDPNYRTQAEQADWIGSESKIMRDLYERGAQIRGGVLIIPAEEHELNSDRETPFITTVSYALERIDDVEKAVEFHSLAGKISGSAADARTQIVVFKTFYNQFSGEGGNRAGALSQTLEEMRRIAIEMEKLEPLEFREPNHQDESEYEERGIEYSAASRAIRLSEDSLRFPADLPYETKERLVSITIPEIDRRLEGGVTKAGLFAAIDRTMLQPDLRTNDNEAKTRLPFTDQERDERSRIAGFLKTYIEERLRDPETRALNSSPQFRLEREEFINAKTLEDLGRVAENFLRINRRRSEERRLHISDPEHNPRPAADPLSARERNLLFNGRAPDHHSAEMRDLRINYGLSRMERAERVEKVVQGLIEPSESLRNLIDELEARKTVRAIGHFQASLFHEQMKTEGGKNLNLLYTRIAPHERTYLYQQSEGRKQSLLKNQNKQEKFSPPLNIRSFGTMPKESESLREYLAAMNQVERRLLNDEVRRLGINLTAGRDDGGITIAEARSLIPEQSAREIRLRTRDLAWERIVPGEVLEKSPLPAAIRISDTVAHIQEHLQEMARTAQNARNDFLAEKIQEAQNRADPTGLKSETHTKEAREKFVQSVIDGFSRADRQKLEALDLYSAQTREEVYRGFSEIDDQLRNLKQSRSQIEIRRIEFGASMNHENGSYLIEPARFDQEWRFDSLRDVLKPDHSDHQVISLERSDYLDHSPKENFVLER